MNKAVEMSSLRMTCTALVAIVASLGTIPLEAAEPSSDCDLERGERVFEVCETCHTLDHTEPELTGPTLDGIYGRKAASIPDFPYSDAMRAIDWTWNAETLGRFIANPDATVPGNEMVSRGIRNDADREALICLLREVSE
ncbi:MAG TPA: c-type cytochrome [Steroidobacteraceae bacterium]|nr:c-type cytochrome [Steroidobacteraceae bacterium]